MISFIRLYLVQVNTYVLGKKRIIHISYKINSIYRIFYLCGGFTVVDIYICFCFDFVRRLTKLDKNSRLFFFFFFEWHTFKV